MINRMAPLRFLVSGPGLIGKRHCALIQERNDSTLGAIVAPRTVHNVRTAQHFGVELYESIDVAFEKQRYDAAIISSPNSFHYTQVKFCLEMGVPVLVEKPLTDNIHDAYDLVKRQSATGVPVLVGHHRMHSPLISIAKKFMDSADFGRLVAINGTALFYKPEHYFIEGPWRTRVGGGPLLINLIHEIGMLRYFGGDISTVTALQSNSIRGFEVEDTVSIAFQFRSGASGTFLVSDASASSKSWEMTTGENPAYPHYFDEDCYHFAGTMGSLDFPTMRARTYKGCTHPSWFVPFISSTLDSAHDDPLRRQLSHFVEIIKKGVQPLVSARDGYQNMLVLESIRSSLDTHSVKPVFESEIVTFEPHGLRV